MDHFEFILIPLTAVSFLAALAATAWMGGLRNNLFHVFMIAVQLYYFFTAPVVYFFTGQWYSINQNVREYFGIGFLQILLHLLFYLGGYALLRRKRSPDYVGRAVADVPRYRELMTPKIVGIFIFLYLVIFLNTLSEGINLVDVFVGKYGDPTMGLKGGTYFLQNFADSLIALIVAGAYFKIRRRYILFMVVTAMPLFIILGFRYRIFLTIFGLILVYFYYHGIRWSSAIRYLIVGGALFYFAMLLTQNRNALYMQHYDEVTFDPTEFPYELVINQAKGSMVDFALYKAYNDDAIELDHGRTMFAYVIIKALPAQFFPDGQKPYPPPQLEAIDKAILGGREIGEACTAIGCLFFAFNYPGIYVGGFVLGAVVGLLQRRIRREDVFSGIQGLLVAVVLFQWLTRGYFPQLVDHLVYVMAPIVFLKLYSARQIRRLSPPAPPEPLRRLALTCPE